MRLITQLRGVDTLSLRTRPLIDAARRGAGFGVSEAGQILVEEEKNNVPVDTGNLRDHIHAELVESTETRVVVAVSPAYEDPGPYGIDPAYARRIEEGFVDTDSLGRVYHQAAQPFVRTSWDAKQGDARQAIVDGIYSELDAVKR